MRLLQHQVFEEEPPEGPLSIKALACGAIYRFRREQGR